MCVASHGLTHFTGTGGYMATCWPTWLYKTVI